MEPKAKVLSQIAYTPTSEAPARLTKIVARRGAHNAIASITLDVVSIIVAVVASISFPLTFAASDIALAVMPYEIMAWVGAYLLIVRYTFDIKNYSFFQELAQIGLASGAAALMFMGVLYVTSVTLPMTFVAGSLGLALACALGWRFAAYAAAQLQVASQILNPRRVLIVGANSLGQHVTDLIEQSPMRDIEIVGYIDDNRTEKFNDKPVLGNLQKNVFELIETERIDEIMLVLPHSYYEQPSVFIQNLKYVSAKVRIVPGYLNLSMYRAGAYHIDDLPLATLRPNPMTRKQRILKRGFDMLVSGTGIIAVLPVMLTVAIAIWLEDRNAPILFVQERMGEGGKPFKIYKFRSMIKGADKMVDQIKMIDEDGNTINKRPDDFRVTRVGKFIRKTSLDELPQLFNVFKGDMSLVGPRPETMSIIHEHYKPWQHERFSVPQGITGWWQVNGRSETECYRATDLDIYYIHNYSLWLDIKILLMTVPALLKGKGAF